MALRLVDRRTIVTLTACIAGLALAPARDATAQGGGGQQQPYENLKYFSKDTPRDSMLAIMRGFTYALGVQCRFCHVEEPASGPNGRARLRPPLDDKREKRTARFMLHMVDTLNRSVLAALPERSDPAVRISCVTCHRGSPIPGTIETVLADALDKFGSDTAIARYRRLRENAGSGRYDMTEVPVNELARSLAVRGKSDQAIALLRMNQEFNPNSAEIDFVLGDIYEKQGDKAAAITRYEAVLTKRPNDPRARQRLTNLRKPPG
jgi:tetratricopeptide (TPR) repeat protein